jgi:stage IV sporulation protein FA
MSFSLFCPRFSHNFRGQVIGCNKTAGGCCGMKNRADEIRKRYQMKVGQKSSDSNYPYVSTPNRNPYSSEKMGSERSISSGFLMRILGAICLFLLVGVLFKSQASELDGVRNFVKQTFENEFQFTQVSAWYEEQFGKPLALLPAIDDPKEADENINVKAVYALPATVTQSFEDNGKGILLETGSNSDVVAVNAGQVTYIGEKENLGKTIIIQHSDGSETWYGMLESINKDVKIYDVVEKGASIGKVSKSEENTGQFYFAVKKDDSFIDPLQVVNFD